MKVGNKRIKVFINASTVLISGGLFISLDIIKALQKNEQFDITVSCPSSKSYKKLENENCKLRYVPHWMLKRYFRWYLDFIWLPSLIKKRNPKLVLTLCNLPAVTRYKQIYLHDNPYVSEESIHYIKLSVGKQLINKIRGYITLSRMKFVDLLIVQTDYQKKKLQKKIRKSIPIKIIPPCIPFNDDISYDEVNTDFFYNNKTFKIFCPARYYEHKNLEVLLKVSNLLIEQKIPAKLYVTISAKHGSKARKLLKKINTPSMNIALENLGHKSRRLMSAFYKKADAVLLPSLLESFSLVCIESWFYKKPLIVSDLETFKSSCENAALYFNPLNASDIFLRIKELIFDRDKQDELIKNGTEKIKQLPDIHNLSKIYSDLIISCCE